MLCCVCQVVADSRHCMLSQAAAATSSCNCRVNGHSVKNVSDVSKFFARSWQKYWFGHPVYVIYPLHLTESPDRDFFYSFNPMMHRVKPEFRHALILYVLRRTVYNFGVGQNRNPRNTGFRQPYAPTRQRFFPEIQSIVERNNPLILQA